MDWLSDCLRIQGSFDEVRQAALRPRSASTVRAANVHIHLPPNFSAFECVDQAVDLAARQDVCILGASNYYDFSVYAPFAERCLGRGIYPLFGLEIIALVEDLKPAGVLINDPGNPGKMYLCGKGIVRFAGPTAEARSILEAIRAHDEERMRRMTALLAKIFAAGGVETGLDDTRIIERIVLRQGVDRGIVTLQERHLAQAFQEEFFQRVRPAQRRATLSRIFGRSSQADPDNHVQVQNEIRSHLMKVGKPAFVEESFVNPGQAYRLVLELGGIPCYPTLADGAFPICQYEEPLAKLVRTLEDSRIYCVEFIPLRNDREVLERYVLAFRDAGFVVTAGTEHNTLDLVAMEPACRHLAPVPARVRQIFLEGAHVIVAHQYLTLHGRVGFVDGEGRLNPDFTGREERIHYFQRLGEEIVTRKLAATHG